MAIWCRCIFILLVALATTSAATALDASPVRMRGEIVGVHGQSLSIRTRDGRTVRVELTSDAKVVFVVPAKLETVAPGTFVSTIAIPRSDSRLTALSVIVHPKEMSGAGEGQHPWDLTKETTITNGTVRRAEANAGGYVLTLRYHDREKTVVAPSDTSVVILESGDTGGLRLGRHVFMPAASQRPDGTFSTTLIAIGKDLVPPM